MDEAKESLKAISRLSMRLGNQAVEMVADEGLSGGVVNCALDRIERAERELAAYKQAAEEFENEHWEGGQIEARAASILAANARD